MATNFAPTTALHKVAALRKRIRGISGGTSASKTISILMWLIDYAQSHDNELISVVSESFPHLKKGAMRDFLNIMQDTRYYNDARWNRTDSIYTFETGSKLEFFSADSPDKVRGPRRDVLFMNEANNMNYETYTQLEVRTRKIIIIDHNPVNEYWWYTEVMPNNDVDFLTLTYKDNESLDQNIVDSIESRRANKGWFKVYGEGQLGEVDNKIYTDWKLDLDEIPHEARLERYGLDFGFSNDPTAIVAIYRYNGGYILDEILYRKGFLNKEIFDHMSNLPHALICADSAEPKSIAELQLYGLNIVGASKGPGSVKAGIDFVQSQRITVTKRSTNIKKAYNNYLWKVDRDGKKLNDPDHYLSDLMDAARYGLDGLNIHTERRALHKPAYQR